MKKTLLSLLLAVGLVAGLWAAAPRAGGSTLVETSADGISNYRMYQVNAQGTPVPTPSASGSFATASSGMVAYTALSSVATTLTITSKSFITLAGGPAVAAGYKFQFTNSVVAPWNLTTGAQVGNYNATTATSQVWAYQPCWLHIAGQGATAAPWVQIDTVP